ncbi:MAG: Asp-tRNA(Asn)/Glu-tRNA(Gln) amidotransferase subunit GatA [Candidatus Aenigmarchaeota archaeon]|nr:Asp-tRNA(Asn)/Glu-tRNA(Gln) amidotransferase subunit GatA [Candidatus Aenigmarchaeota archaeon]
MNYRMSVSEFLEKADSINLQDFYSKLFTRVAQLDQKYGFFVTVAEKPHKDGLKKSQGKLKGLPVSVKDNICVQGMRCTAGSRILESYIPPFDSTVAARIKKDGGLIIGKTSQDEFGFGTFCVNSAFNVPKNPIDSTRSCGGSSGGAAGLTAALDMPHIAIGQSTGGSISAPASFCGVIGLTPTYGLVSRYGLIDYANSLDKIGPIGRGVEDVALMLSVIAGHDPRDFTTVKKGGGTYAKYLEKPVKGMRIGVPKDYFGEGVDSRVSEQVWRGIKALESEGMKYTEISLPMTRHSLSAYYIIACAEASTNLAKFCGMRYGAEGPVEESFNEYFSGVRSGYFGEEAKRRILLGTYARMAGFREKFYLKALQVRTLIIREFRNAFRSHDVLIAPTMPVIAPKFSEIAKLTPVENYMMDILTVAPNLAGIPMLSIPCGKVSGMPVGLHIMGDYLQEGKLLQVGHAFEGI